MHKKTDIIYYSHWNHPDFDISHFQRWHNFQPFSQNNINVYDRTTSEISRYNLKLFFDPSYPIQKLDIIVGILHHLDFSLVHKEYDRYIFKYNVDESLDHKEYRETYSFIKNLIIETTETLLTRIQDHKFIQSVVEDITESAIEKADVERLKNERSQIISFQPNMYKNAGYFIIPANCDCGQIDCVFHRWRSYVRDFQTAVHWKRYYLQTYGKSIDIQSTLLLFKENELLPGGKWIDMEDPTYPLSITFYSEPPLILPPTTQHLSLSEEFDILDIPSTTPCRIYRYFRFFNLDKKLFTGASYNVVSYGDISLEHEEMFDILYQSELKSALYKKEEFKGITLEKINIGSDVLGRPETILEYRRIKK